MTSRAPIVLFSGQRIATPDQPGPFPIEIEAVVRQALRNRLIDLGVMIGYASASAGGDIIFGEELVALGGELNLYLPCEQEDFVTQFIAPAGEHWVRRFRALCAAAKSVKISCEERLLGDETLLHFNNQILQGMVRLRAEALGVDPHLLLLWSALAPAEPGSPADFLDQWPGPAPVSFIDLDDLSGSQASAPDSDQDDDDFATLDAEFNLSPRATRAILFADIAGFTRFDEEEVTLVFDFLAEAQHYVEAHAKAPILLNTWGDAVHAAAETAHDLADYASALTTAMATIDPASFGLPHRPQFRIAMHAGPVFVGIHPLAGHSMVFGRHVSRAARIEPIALAGAVCASQHFACLLKSEMDRQADEARQSGKVYTPRYVISHFISAELPKQFGTEDIYLLHDNAQPGQTRDAFDEKTRIHFGPSGSMQLRLRNDLAEISTLATRIDAFCAINQLSPDIAYAVNLALDELLANTIGYGFEGIDDPAIDVTLRLDGDTLTTILADTGIAYDPTEAPVPDLEASVEDRPIGGLGVFLVKEMMDTMTYCRRDGRNEVTLTKSVRESAPNEE